MKYYIGIDLGTSAVKLLLLDENGKIIKSVSKEYPLCFPNPGWAEQNPDDWWEKVKEGIAEIADGTDKSEIKGLGCGGQMHGLVILDENDEVIRPAILWNDGRTFHETEWLNEEIGKDKLSGYTANIAFAGFTAPKLLWLKKNEPENFNRIKKIMLPKDYINYKLTGVHACDYSDASGMLLMDVKNKCWSDEMLKICGVSASQMPKLFESFEVIGNVNCGILPETVKVCAGAGDNAAAAVGTGTVFDGACNISLGTSGTIFISSDKFGVDPFNALHSFAHANGKYHLMGCMLSAASCNKWFCEDILKTDDFASEQSGITDEKLGNNHVYFLPYLMGERSPINDTNAKGTFTGLTMDSTRSDMILAVLEGVAFAFRDSLEVAKELGIKIERSKLCGGGAKSPLWQKIIANVLNIEIEIPVTEEGPGYGAAMLSMVATEQFSSVKDCADAFIKTVKTIKPDAEISKRYDAQYKKFREIYPALKEVFKLI
ncbi:MAG: xylulokinase [Lachnospiraceae bacterium]|nr:xylulokinase [Lachnospiraceae bacterium]